MNVEIITAISFEFTPHRRHTYSLFQEIDVYVSLYIYKYIFPPCSRSHWHMHVGVRWKYHWLGEETNLHTHLSEWSFSWQWQTRNPHRRPLQRSNSLKAPRHSCGDHSGCLSSFARLMASILIGWVTCPVLSTGVPFTHDCFIALGGGGGCLSHFNKVISLLQLCNS